MLHLGTIRIEDAGSVGRGLKALASPGQPMLCGIEQCFHFGEYSDWIGEQSLRELVLPIAL
jgi:hypothetical protein